MTLLSSAHDTLVPLAEAGNAHASLSPYVTGGGALLALLLLLWVVTRFNRDR
jgi:hypothetical protein